MRLQGRGFSRIVLALGAAVGLSACAATDVTRDLPLGSAIDAATPAALAILPDIDVTAINVTVPDSLTSSEINTYYPNSDIVWHGDPAGNRHEQVGAVLRSALEVGTEDMHGARKVVLDVVMTKFHAVTPKTRYTVGGRHEIEFDLRVLDAATGEVLMPTRHVVSNFKALRGNAALAAEAEGITQKVRIVGHMSKVIRAELAAIENYAVAAL